MQGKADAASANRWRDRYATAAVAIGACALAYAAMETYPSRPIMPAACQPGRPHPMEAHDAQSVLRQHAIMGDADASAALVHALLDAYEASADASALVDALQWLQRDLYTPQMLASGQIARVIEGACRHDALLREQWLCHQGE
jgi:hypothetical protein